MIYLDERTLTLNYAILCLLLLFSFRENRIQEVSVYFLCVLCISVSGMSWNVCVLRATTFAVKWPRTMYLCWLHSVCWQKIEIFGKPFSEWGKELQFSSWYVSPEGLYGMQLFTAFMCLLKCPKCQNVNILSHFILCSHPFWRRYNQAAKTYSTGEKKSKCCYFLQNSPRRNGK